MHANASDHLTGSMIVCIRVFPHTHNSTTRPSPVVVVVVIIHHTSHHTHSSDSHRRRRLRGQRWNTPLGRCKAPSTLATRAHRVECSGNDPLRKRGHAHQGDPPSVKKHRREREKGRRYKRSSIHTPHTPHQPHHPLTPHRGQTRSAQPRRLHTHSIAAAHTQRESKGTCTSPPPPKRAPRDEQEQARVPPP